jgi:ribonuclease D
MYTLEECLDMWRDKTAWEYNKKKNEIMDDATLKYIAKNKPLTKAALPKKYHNEMGDEIISIIRNSLYSK